MEVVVSDVLTKVTELAKQRDMSGRSKVTVNEHSQVSNGVDRTNNCASDGERMTGKLW